MSDREEQARRLKKLLEPVWLEITEAAEEADFVIACVNPGKLARKVFRKLGWASNNFRGGVWAVSGENAILAFGHDLVTRRFFSTPPEPDTIKMLLVAGDGSSLLTLKIENGTVTITPESDLHPV